ncbi:uncharacterized protein LOC121379100 [Gigantopelta aegis]|uniref:uncharacterized protein LOC121379100 n=1 Tax=Gigantopelta aegis TaxID=1735272 RepID=UPI001B888208|nr:uncharacterized protein LOC121379100 [Gigantopelta aegis]
MWIFRTQRTTVMAVIAFTCFISKGKNAVISQTFNGENLSCYDCSESFKVLWTPFTDCQSNLSNVPLAKCHYKDRYCKVERTSVKGMTISVARGCAEECFYGCRIEGFGVTQLKCTSCCRQPGCNTGNEAKRLRLSAKTLTLSLWLCGLVTFFSEGQPLS